MTSEEFTWNWLSRFWEKVNKTKGCWYWLGKPSRNGYGNFKLNYKQWIAHRLSWFIHYGDPGEKFVCHKCDNPLCVRPDHLFLGTHQDNMDDMYAKGRGRKASGKDHGLVKNPSAAASGKDHWSIKYPDKVPKGEKSSSAKLTRQEVLEIRKRYDSGERHADIAKDFSVNKGTISKIGLRIRWKHL